MSEGMQDTDLNLLLREEHSRVVEDRTLNSEEAIEKSMQHMDEIVRTPQKDVEMLTIFTHSHDESQRTHYIKFGRRPRSCWLPYEMLGGFDTPPNIFSDLFNGENDFAGSDEIPNEQLKDFIRKKWGESRSWEFYLKRTRMDVETGVPFYVTCFPYPIVRILRLDESRYSFRKTSTDYVIKVRRRHGMKSLEELSETKYDLEIDRTRGPI